MTYFLLVIYFIGLFILAIRNFKAALGIFILSLPTYLIRFHIGGFPSTMLELGFAALALGWVGRYAKIDCKNIAETAKKYPLFFVLLTIFFLSSVVGVLVSGEVVPALGIWRAYFLEPIALFLILLGRRDSFTKDDIIWMLGLSTLSITYYSIWQSQTGEGIATKEWAAAATRRVTAFFTSPNSVALYIVPPAVLLINLVYEKMQNWKNILDVRKRKRSTLQILMLISMVLLSVLALLFTKSDGGVVALGVALVILLYFWGYKKTAGAAVLLAIIAIVTVPKVHEALLFQNKSGENRFKLWGFTWDYVSESPQHFLFGAGVRQFHEKIQKPRNDFKTLEAHIYPHNLFLNFWSEIGFFGMLSLVGVLGYMYVVSWKLLTTDRLGAAGCIASLTVLVVHGLVDVPYFKNDLAFLWWVIMLLPFLLTQPKTTDTQK